MKRFFQRLGIFPYLLIGGAFIYLGVVTVDYLTTTIWLIDVERLDLIRAVAQDRADAPLLLEAAYPEVILAFLLSVGLAFIGLALPFAYILNRRFNRRLATFLSIVRQSMWVGFWVSFCVWLQMNRTLSIPVAILVAAVFVLLELIFQVRARTIEPQSPSTVQGA